jgi:hypothetical protein
MSRTSRSLVRCLLASVTLWAAALALSVGASKSPTPAPTSVCLHYGDPYILKLAPAYEAFQEQMETVSKVDWLKPEFSQAVAVLEVRGGELEKILPPACAVTVHVELIASERYAVLAYKTMLVGISERDPKKLDLAMRLLDRAIEEIDAFHAHYPTLFAPKGTDL